MKKTIVQITTAETEGTHSQTYSLPDKTAPQLWAVELRVAALDRNGHHNFPPFSTTTKTIYLEREVLTNHGLIGKRPDPVEPAADPQPTAEELIIQLLELVGYFPEGD